MKKIARKIVLKKLPGWWITGSRKFYKGVRKSEKSYRRALRRKEKIYYEELGGWDSRKQFEDQMSTSQGERWIEQSRVDVDESGYPDISGAFSQGYREAMEDSWDTDAGGAFAEFLEHEVGVREEDAMYAVGDTPDV